MVRTPRKTALKAKKIKKKKEDVVAKRTKGLDRLPNLGEGAKIIRKKRRKINKKNKKAINKLKMPETIRDATNKNPFFNNIGHVEAVNKQIQIMADKFGDDSIVVTHYIDGSAIGVAELAQKQDDIGNETLPRTMIKRDDYVWVGVRKPLASGTVE